MQEAKGFEANRAAWLYALEERLGMRILAVALRTDQAIAIFIRAPLRPLSTQLPRAAARH